MKKLLCVLLGLTLINLYIATTHGAPASCSTCECEATGKSFLYIRPLFQSASPELVTAVREDRVTLKQDGLLSVAELVVFGSRSTKPENLARYFFPNCKSELAVSDSGGIAIAPADLFAQNFNIFTLPVAGNPDGIYESTIEIRPRQTVIGVGFYARKAFCQNWIEGRGFWASINFPFQHVKNNANLCEQQINTGGGPNLAANDIVFSNMIDALNSPQWLYGKITNCNLTKNGVADIELKLGYEWIERDPYHLESYIGVKVPTGNKPKAHHLFEPIVGNGGHVGIMFGNAGGLQIWQSCEDDRNLRMEWMAHSQYLFKNRQHRSFDLLNRPWSRYLPLYENLAQAQEALALSVGPNPLLAVNLSTPGINLLTLQADVTPGFQSNMITSFIYNNCNWQAEAGYNLYLRRGECVELACPFPDGIAIKSRFGEGNTNPINNITNNFRITDTLAFTSIEFYNFNVITQDQIDTRSAATPCAISHTLFGAATYHWDDQCFPTLVSAGGSYEFTNSNNAILDRWVVWGKLAISF